MYAVCIKQLYVKISSKTSSYLRSNLESRYISPDLVLIDETQYVCSVRIVTFQINYHSIIQSCKVEDLAQRGSGRYTLSSLLVFTKGKTKLKTNQ